MDKQVHIHRAVLVPRRKGCDVYPSLEKAPDKVRRTLENGQSFTIVIADKSSVERMKHRVPAAETPSIDAVPLALAREALICLALLAAILILAVSR
jgi:hypothetical protein